jgi:hypothetical protein
LRKIRFDRQCPDACGFNFPGDFVAVGLAGAVVDCNIGAALGELKCDVPANAAGSPGDQGYLAFEILHDTLL